ncbi:MAG: helix-turn-helix transcriptional regulator [Candidatus Aminicenantes bacterium]|nr:helix-turn-helix transcriptional regulator [Candidatus Aminicenantes bacterium]
MDHIGTFGQRLKQLRKEFRLSQDAFAKQLGVSQYTLSNYETEKRFPDIRFFTKLKDITNVNLNWLIMGEITISDFCPDIKIDEDVKEFFSWFNKISFVRHSILKELVDLKYRYPDIFKNSDTEKANEIIAKNGGKK